MADLIISGMSLTGGGMTITLPPTSATIADTYFNYTTILLSGDGTNNATNATFLDSSTNNFTITRNGNTTQGTFSPYGDNWSAYIPSAGQTYIRAGSNSALALGSGNFTVECWVYLNSLAPSYSNLFDWRTNGGSESGIPVITDFNNNGTLTFAVGLGSGFTQVVTSSSTMPINSWFHLAIVRNSSTITMYFNGVSVGSGTNSSTLGVETFNIGNPQVGNYTPPMYISNLRLVKGTAVYTANFTPSTAPLTAISGTSLLTCADNRLIDDSTNAFTITKNGDVSVQRFSPFSPTAAYSAATIGGSAYFDGSGDWLQIANNSAFNLGSSDFTVEAWVYPTAGTDRQIISKNQGSYPGGFEWNFTLRSDNLIQFNGYGTSYFGAISSATILTNTWTHIAAVRNGATIAVYVNGVSSGTVSAQTFQTTSSAVSVARDLEDGGGGGRYFTGYISNLRVVKGTAVYTSTFTPPTTPLTAISGTSLLTNFTNAGIIDNTMISNLETVGDAKISTTQSKFGGSSMLFDGTGDYLKFASSQNLAMTGDFTIEMWIYPNNWTGSNVGVVSGASNSIQISSYGGFGTFGIAIQGVEWIISNASLPTTSTWSHLAITRAGTSVKIFLNGTQSGSTGTSSQSFTPITVVGFADGGTAFNGYIDDLRITKGYARYTTTFTPPTAALPTQ